MALKLKWKNPNPGATTVDIYRGNSSNVDLTTPLVTVPNGTLEWIDTTAEFGKTYYYVWAVNTATDRVVSQPQKIEVSDRKGPGSNVLVHGTEAYGFFGTLTAADFINTAPILAAAKNTTGLPTGVSYPSWYKFIRNGKVLFVPNSYLADVHWNTLYNAGFVYGANNNGPDGAGNVNQLSTFELNGDLFLIRCVKGYPEGVVYDGGVPVDFDTWSEVVDKYSEYEDLMYPLFDLSPVRQRMVTVGNDPYSNFMPGAWNSTSRYTYGVICQEMSGGFNVGRGGGYMSNTSPTRANAKQAIRKLKSDMGVWWPVIEYIGRVGEVDLSKVGV